MSTATNQDESVSTPTSDQAVSCQGISKSFAASAGQVAAIQDVSFEMSPGEFVAIRGKSGCGKSTLMLCLGGLQKPDSGMVSIDGHSLYAMSADQRAKFRGQHIGYVFQQFHLIPYLDVVENIMAARIGVGEKSDASDKARELVDRVGLLHRTTHKPDALSIGECQRVAIARALMNDPKVILADEPTGNLDQENTDTVLSILKEIANSGTAVALVTHDAQIDTVADRVVMMADGRIV